MPHSVTTIENDIREPEVAILARFLNEIGAHITGVGIGKVVVKGVQELRS